MHADFTAPDGRKGSVSVSLAEYEAHGEAALMEAARFVVFEQRRHDAYAPPERDRFNELN
ncbi:hypothetical protein [Sphingomonas sp. URHD0057]|uniref:hypothetical protein n=1 Tax=Sphingomonas sp. URHD0057 TaxID=1380389 RepID=UPI000ABD5478|nr:hypothetical protein [Sphingomonas sp. URHD0057]